MKKKIVFIMFLSLLAIFCFFNTAHAALSVETAVDVPASCTVTDTDGVTHNYGETSYLAICALEAAIGNGSVSDVQLSNAYPTLGLFITAINNVVADPNSQYWAIYQNGNMANLGVTSLPIVAGDTILFQLDDFSNNNLGNQVTLHIHSLITLTAIPVGSGPLLESAPTTTISTVTPIAAPPPTAKPTFDPKKALDFLTAQQNDNGSFGVDLYTDWTALALASSGIYQAQTIKLIKYYEQAKLENPTLTDYERHAMALMALGLNPYNTNGENYINDMIKGFDGKQFGDTNEDNDDIFALIVLQNAGYTQNDSIINSDLNFILSKQDTDGSWDDSVDMTGAAMEALSAFSQTGQIRDALAKAENYLEQNQKDDGSWNDSASSTAWAMEGVLAQGEKPEDWAKNSDTPLDYLATLQDTDGGVKDSDLNTKIWETAYVTSALSGKTWNQIMQSFTKENLPALAVNLPTLTPKTENTNTVSIKKTENKISKKENFAGQNIATVLNAITPSPATIVTPIPQKNWFERLLAKIF